MTKHHTQKINQPTEKNLGTWEYDRTQFSLDGNQFFLSPITWHFHINQFSKSDFWMLLSWNRSCYREQSRFGNCFHFSKTVTIFFGSGYWSSSSHPSSWDCQYVIYWSSRFFGKQFNGVVFLENFWIKCMCKDSNF